jgi:hypothetical protein
MTPERWIGVLYVLMMFVVVGINLPVPSSPEERCANYIQHLKNQLARPGAMRMVPNLDTKYNLCVEQMTSHDQR